MNPRSEDSWRCVADALDQRDRSDEARAMFWMVIDAWIRDLILVGPDNDTSACRVRARFRSLLPDPHAALDFAADLVLERVGHWAAGRFDQAAWKDMDRRRGLAGIASSSFVRLRALSALRHRTAGGVVGLPADGERGWSLDAGVEGGFDLPVETGRAASETAEDLTALLASLEAGRPVLRLHAPSDRIGAILVTAALQLLLRLVPDDPTNGRAIEAMDRETRFSRRIAPRPRGSRPRSRRCRRSSSTIPEWSRRRSNAWSDVWFGSGRTSWCNHSRVGSSRTCSGWPPPTRANSGIRSTGPVWAICCPNWRSSRPTRRWVNDSRNSRNLRRDDRRPGQGRRVGVSTLPMRGRFGPAPWQDPGWAIARKEA